MTEIERLKPAGLDGFETLKALLPELPLPLIIFVIGSMKACGSGTKRNSAPVLVSGRFEGNDLRKLDRGGCRAEGPAKGNRRGIRVIVMRVPVGIIH